MIKKVNFCTHPHHIFHFVRSGYPDIVNGVYRSGGVNGFDWSGAAMAYDGTLLATSHDFNFDLLETYPSDGPYPRFLGYPIRCLVY